MNINKNTIIEKILFYIILIFPILYLKTSLLNLGISIISVLFLLYCVKKKFYNWLKNKIVIITLVFWVYLLISSILNYQDIERLAKSIFYIRFILFFFAIAFVLPLLNFNLRKIFQFYTYIIIFFIFDILFQFYFGKNILGYDCLMSCTRNASFFKEELIAGTFLLYIGLISFSFYFYFTEEKKNNFLFFFAIALLTVAIILTGDRTPSIIIILFIFLNIIFNSPLRKIFSYISCVILVLLSIIFTMSESLNYRFFEASKAVFGKSDFDEISLKFIIKNNTLRIKEIDELKSKTNEDIITKKEKEEETEKLVSRLENRKIIKELRSDDPDFMKNIYFFYDSNYGAHYLTSIEIIKDNFILGSGIRSYRDECIKYSYINSISKAHRCSTHPHNLHLEIFSEIGLIGYALIFVIFILSLTELLKSQNKINRITAILIFLILITYIFPFRPSGAFFSSWYGSIFWFILGCFYLSINDKKIKK